MRRELQIATAIIATLVLTGCGNLDTEPQLDCDNPETVTVPVKVGAAMVMKERLQCPEE